jgi:agmatinase
MIRQNGIQQVLELIPDNARCIVTLDCDGLDPSVIPGVLVPQPGGLSYLDVVELLHGLSRRARIIGFDLVELMPSSDVRGLGVLAAARIVRDPRLPCSAEEGNRSPVNIAMGQVTREP